MQSPYFVQQLTSAGQDEGMKRNIAFTRLEGISDILTAALKAPHCGRQEGKATRPSLRCDSPEKSVLNDQEFAFLRADTLLLHCR